MKGLISYWAADINKVRQRVYDTKELLLTLDVRKEFKDALILNIDIVVKLLNKGKVKSGQRDSRDMVDSRRSG